MERRSGVISRPAWCRPAPCCVQASERPRAMTADVSQDRRVTATHPGWSTRFVDGSRLCWALPSPVHEGLWYRAFVPDRIQGDAVFPHASFTAQSRITFAVERDRSRRPSTFALGSPSSRRGLDTTQSAAPPQCRPALTTAAPGALQNRGRDEEKTSDHPRN